VNVDNRILKTAWWVPIFAILGAALWALIIWAVL